MAGAKIVTGIDTDVYIKLNPSSTDVPDTKTHAALTGASAIAGASANKVGVVLAVGDLALEGNVIRYGVYGEGSDRSLPGQSSLGDFTVDIALDRSQAVIKGVQDAAIGSKIAVALRTADNDGGETVDLIQGSLAGKTVTRPLDAAAQVSLTIAMSAAFASYDKA